jgi:hypothetical protein
MTTPSFPASREEALRRAGYGLDDTPMLPKRSAYTDDPFGAVAFRRALERWTVFSTLTAPRCQACGFTSDEPLRTVEVLEDDPSEGRGEFEARLCIDCIDKAHEESVVLPRHLNFYSTDHVTWMVMS